MKILINSIKCPLCGDILVSTHRHDFVKCKCEKDWVACDGGKDYLKRTGIGYVELSMVEVEYTDMAQMYEYLRQFEKVLNTMPNSYIPSLDMKTYEIASSLNKFLNDKS